MQKATALFVLFVVSGDAFTSPTMATRPLRTVKSHPRMVAQFDGYGRPKMVDNDVREQKIDVITSVQECIDDIGCGRTRRHEPIPAPIIQRAPPPDNPYCVRRRD